MTSGTNYAPYGVWGTTQEVYVVGKVGTMLKYANNWQSVITNTSYVLHGVAGIDENTVLSSGNYGTLLYYNGTQGELMNANTTNIIFNVKGENRCFYAVGVNGTIEFSQW